MEHLTNAILYRGGDLLFNVTLWLAWIGVLSHTITRIIILLSSLAIIV